MEPNVSSYLKRWFDKKAKALAPLTAEGLASFLKRWRATIGERPAAELCSTDVESVEMAAVALGRSASHLNKERTYFREFVRYLADCGVCVPSVDVWKRRKEVVKKQYVCLTKDQEELLCANAPDWLRAFICFAAATGLRAGTIRALTWDHIVDGVVCVPAGIMKARRPLRLPLSGKAFAALGLRGEGLLFPGLPDSRRLYYEFKKAARRAPGVPQHCNVHDLRRTFAGRLLQTGTPTAVVMRLGGWASESVLLKHYVGELDEASSRAYLERI